MFSSLFYLSPLSQLSLLHLPPLSLSSLTLSFLDLINLNKFASPPPKLQSNDQLKGTYQTHLALLIMVMHILIV